LGDSSVGAGIRGAPEKANSYPLALAVTGQKDLENSEYFDVTCPHGAVTFRLSRKK